MLPLADTQLVEATWIMVVKSLVIFGVIFGILPLMTVLERKLIGRFQHRYGPNRVGPFGILQPLADVGKLLSKEAFRPANAIGTLFILGPLLPVLSGVLALAIIPWGDVQGGVGLDRLDPPVERCDKPRITEVAETAVGEAQARPRLGQELVAHERAARLLRDREDLTPVDGGHPIRPRRRGPRHTRNLQARCRRRAACSAP